VVVEEENDVPAIRILTVLVRNNGGHRYVLWWICAVHIDGWCSWICPVRTVRVCVEVLRLSG
jgi:hypothetical protein